MGGGGGPNFGSERTVELFSWQVTSPPHSLPPVAVTQIIGGYPKQLHFSISLEFSLVAKCNARFIKKISQFKRNIRSCRCKNFSLKQASGLIEGAERGGGGGGHDPPLHCLSDKNDKNNKNNFIGKNRILRRVPSAARNSKYGSGVCKYMTVRMRKVNGTAAW